MKNGLYIVSTPIGNLDDISLRATETLKSSDLIICENPKHSLKLLLKLGIKKKLISMHDYNEESVIEKVKKSLKNKKLSLITDAGSPLISDPGYKLVRFCSENKIFVTVVPGPSSVISALQISSIPINQYTFHGFAPKTKKNIDEFINVIEKSTFTSVVLISKHKIMKFLEILSNKIPNRKMAVCKELTKINEKVFIGKSIEVFREFKENSKNTLGEFVLIISGVGNLKFNKNPIDNELEKMIKKLLSKFSLTDTVEIVHKINKIGKKEIYKLVLSIKNEK